MAKTVSATINLKNVDDVKTFVNASMRQDYDIDLLSGRYVVDGKSIMGIFSLDLSKPVDMRIVDETDAGRPLLEELKGLIVD